MIEAFGFSTSVIVTTEWRLNAIDTVTFKRSLSLQRVRQREITESGDWCI